jgi:hypothetical protein
MGLEKAIRHGKEHRKPYTTSMSTYEWVVQSKSKGDRFWKDLVDLPDTINGGQARTRLARYVNNNTDPDLEFRLIVRQETVIA